MFKATFNLMIKEWRFISDQLMVVDMVEKGDVLKTTIVAYKTNDNTITSKKEEFIDFIQRKRKR